MAQKKSKVMVTQLADGDLAVRKFFRPVVLTHTGVSKGGASGLQLEFLDEDGDIIWERAAELRQPRLYAVLPVPSGAKARRRAEAIKKIACARLGVISWKQT